MLMGAVSSQSPAKFMEKVTALPRQNQMRVLLTLATAMVAVFVFVDLLIAALDWHARPFFGAMLSPNLVVDGSRTITTDEWAGLNAGLQRLDHIVAINGQPLSADPADYAAARTNFQKAMAGLQPGEKVEVTFDRPIDAPIARRNTAVTCQPATDSLLRCTTSYNLQSISNTDFFTYFWGPFIFGLLTLIVGLVVFYLRPNQPAARVTTVLCVLLGVFMAASFDANNTYQLVPLWLLALSFLSGIIIMLAMVFPVKSTVLFRYPFLYVLPLIFSIGLAAFSLYTYYNPATPQSYSLSYQPGLILMVASVVVFAVSLARRRAMAVSPAVRDQSTTVLIALGLTLAPALIWSVNTLLLFTAGTATIVFNTSAIMPFFLIPPLGLAYAVLGYRSVDTDKVLSQSITYVIMLVVLVIGYFLLVYGANLVLHDMLNISGAVQASNIFLVALMIFAIAVLFLPFRSALQQRIDRLYYRTRTNYQERVESFSRSLTTLTELQQIVESFQKLLQETISPSNVFTFLPSREKGDYVAFGSPRPQTDVSFEAASGIPTLLNKLDGEDIIYLEPGRPWPTELRSERARLNILRTVIIARLRGRNQLVGFVLVGPPLSDMRGYQYEELRFIQNLTNQMAIAVERAQAIDSLERRVRELDVLRQVSEAVNFTLKFDDLLELINAQTEKLVPASHFYIALRETFTDKLYFAFFQENYDRVDDRENRRWLMGRDLFSEVVRKGEAIRVEDYAEEMKRRNSVIIYEDVTMKAWMGVPLITGTTTLGVIAVGTTQPGKPFTDEQLRVFNGIGSLAATSLDKARLFAETNLRARQLSALNNISRELSSELKVDVLLERITRSAVEILDAEAGSLLLTVDDNSGDLEFRVAVGASGQDLIGKRFPGKKGLVGQVATSGKPEIVNDAANDPRWGGEVAKGAFSTTAVLAVPLIAQGRVIGVLEVLNKKTGGVYVPEDADLLTTFAGQAAVALENARLFEMTDLQLNQRVEELQAMERIDVELNRSLDLQKVADITMRWAIASTGASAGVLGMVIPGDPPQLQIVSKYGYDGVDAPEGAEGNLWPLDVGIVRRVMRTRQPDLAPDVRIDPDYVPSLHGSISQLTVPMLSGGEINSLLILETDKEPRLNILDLAFAQRLAEHASIAITNAQFAEQLARANSSKSEFVGFVAHELKNPMTSMKGFADLMLSGSVGELSEPQKNFMGIIRSNVERMITLVNDLNDVTKLETRNMKMEFSPTDFRNVVTETLRPLHKQIEDKHQKLVMNVPENLPQIMADQNRLIQVLTNLVSNAHKYTPPEGDIYIDTRVVERNLDKKGRDLGPMLHVSVRDTGIGMSQEDLAKLFTPYFRSDNPLAREQPGTGLGLTITRGIVQQHGGDVQVESEIGKGTTFRFMVPIVKETEPVPVK
jgi:signal transduction histidine kinase